MILDLIFKWLRIERDSYQVKKFDYKSVEPYKTLEQWDTQFAGYISRLLLFPQESLQHKQAALKLAATAIAYCEFIIADNKFPKPGVPSGEISEWIKTHDWGPE